LTNKWLTMTHQTTADLRRPDSTFQKGFASKTV